MATIFFFDCIVLWLQYFLVLLFVTVPLLWLDCIVFLLGVGENRSLLWLDCTLFLLGVGKKRCRSAGV